MGRRRRQANKGKRIVMWDILDCKVEHSVLRSPAILCKSLLLKQLLPHSGIWPDKSRFRKVTHPRFIKGRTPPVLCVASGQGSERGAAEAGGEEWNATASRRLSAIMSQSWRLLSIILPAA